MTIKQEEGCCDIEGPHTLCHFKKEPASIWNYIMLMCSVSFIIFMTGMYVLSHPL